MQSRQRAARIGGRATNRRADRVGRATDRPAGVNRQADVGAVSGLPGSLRSRHPRERAQSLPCAGAEVVQTSGLAALNARLANTKPASVSTVALEGTPEVLPSAESEPPAVSLGELAERVAQLAREMGSPRYTWQKAIANARKVVGDDDAQVRTYLESLIKRGEEQKATRKEATNG